MACVYSDIIPVMSLAEGEESRTDQASASGEDRRSSDNRPLRADKLTPEDAVKKVVGIENVMLPHVTL